MEQLIQQLQTACAGMRILHEEPLAQHTSFKIGGPAQWMAFPRSEQELAQLLRLCHAAGVRPAVLGAGTNVLAADEGKRGLVICTRDCLTGVRRLDETRLAVLAGTTMAKAACAARDFGLTGLEFAHGIPGTVGGGVFMNAGAYGGEICQVAERTRVLLPDGTPREFAGAEQDFAYRHSAFSQLDCVIVETVLRLQPGDPETIRAAMQELARRRRTSQPLELPSAGSTFKRPVGGYAAALIDAAGLKGVGVGGACVSEKHAGFVVNRGGATAQDVLDTISLVQERVLAHSGIALEPEVRLF